MKFLDLFNEIEKGNYALTDEAIYSSLQNHDDLVPLYGGNKDHSMTERRISALAKTKRGLPIKVFSGEGIIISLDGSAGSMTYKNSERFALNHHAGFITIKDTARNLVSLEFFAIYMQNFYTNLSVSDGSKTLSLNQIYSEEFDLPTYSMQCRILNRLQQTQKKISALTFLKNKYEFLMEKELLFNYSGFQAKDVPISQCIDYMSGNTGITEEYIYQTLQSKDERYPVLSSATEERTKMGTIPSCKIGDKLIKIYKGKDGLLVTRNGNAGQTRFLPQGNYTINDHAYILFQAESSPYDINLKWLSIQYRAQFLQYSSSADNGTWNMTGFFRFTTIDVPLLSEQTRFVEYFELLVKRIKSIQDIEKKYQLLLSKAVA